MKPIRTPQADVTLTLAGAGEEGDLPAQRIMVYDTDQGETEKDARVAFETLWMPDVKEAQALEAGACVQLRIWAIRDDAGNYTQPPVAVGVTDAVLPEREMIDRGHVDRALGLLYGMLRERVITALIQAQEENVTADEMVDTGGEVNPEAVGIPGAGPFVDLWIKAVEESREKPPTAASNGSARADDDGSEEEDLSAEDFKAGLQLMVGTATVDVDALPDGGIMVRVRAHGRDLMAQGRSRRQVMKRLRAALEQAAIDSEHTQREDD